jgi:hypothetical protein
VADESAHRGRTAAVMVPIRSHRGPRMKITKAIFERSRPAGHRRLFCTVTARNAGGSLGTALAPRR